MKPTSIIVALFISTATFTSGCSERAIPPDEHINQSTQSPFDTISLQDNVDEYARTLFFKEIAPQVPCKKINYVMSQQAAGFVGKLNDVTLEHPAWVVGFRYLFQCDDPGTDSATLGEWGSLAGIYLHVVEKDGSSTFAPMLLSEKDKPHYDHSVYFKALYAGRQDGIIPLLQELDYQRGTLHELFQ